MVTTGVYDSQGTEGSCIALMLATPIVVSLDGAGMAGRRALWHSRARRGKGKTSSERIEKGSAPTEVNIKKF